MGQNIKMLSKNVKALKPGEIIKRYCKNSVENGC